MKNLISILNNNENIDEFKITKTINESTELFFVKEEMQMNRGKKVENISITVYKNFEENGKKYKGSSTTVIPPTMNTKEITEKINVAALAASFVKNEYYDLVEPTNVKADKIPSVFSQGNVVKHISNLVQDLYSENNQYEAFINSTEFFIVKKQVQIINSKGVDVSYVVYEGEIELITEAKGIKENIEIYDVLYFGDYDAAWLKENVKDALYKASLRTKAVPLPALKDVPVIITGEAVKQFLSFYQVKASAEMVYNKLSQTNVGDSVQSANVKGDKITATLKPVIPNSTRSRYYDGDGYPLKETKIIEDGILVKYFSGKRFADYLNIETTGNIGNLEFDCGTTSLEDLKKGKYLELLSFSDFQCDSLTGNFGGEIRLGIYYDGETKTPITSGSISGLAKTVDNTMLFSKEKQQVNNFIGPKAIKLNKVNIAGNK